MSEAVKEMFFKVANEEGWFRQQENEKIKKIAKKFLLRGLPVDEVAEATELPIEVVESLV